MANVRVKTDTTMAIEVTILPGFGLINLQNEEVTSKALPPRGAQSQNLIDLTVTIPDRSGLVLIISLTSSQMAQLEPGDYVYDIQFVNSVTGVVRNTDDDSFSVKRSIT